MLTPALAAADALDATVVDMRFVKPLDEDMIRHLAQQHALLVTLEENAVAGGAGSAVNEFLLQHDYRVPVLNLGLPDTFIPHGNVPDMLAAVGLDRAGIVAAVRDKLNRCKIHSQAV